MLNLRAFLGLDAAGFEKGIERSKKQAESFAQSMASKFAGLFTGGALVAGILKFGSLIDRLQDKSKEIRIGTQKTGLDPQSYQKFANTLDAVGSSGEAGAVAMEHLADATVKIKNGEEGSAKLADNLAVLGVSLDDIQRKDYKAIFFQIADGMKTATLSAERLAAIKEIFGKGGIELIPAMKLGFDSAASNRGTISDVDLEKLAELKKIQKESTGWWREMTQESGLFWSGMLSGALKMVATPMEGLLGIGGEGKNEFRDAQREKIQQHEKERAAAQIAAAQQKSINDKNEEKAKKIREHFTAQAEQSDERAAADRFSLLSNEEKLRVLKAQEEVLRHMHGFAETDFLNGDATGEAGAKLSQIEQWQAENAKRQKEAKDAMAKADSVPDTKLNLSASQKVGAQILFNPRVNELQTNNQRLATLGTKVENLTKAMEKTGVQISRDGGAFSEGMGGGGGAVDY